jgi:hypothetical protein
VFALNRPAHTCSMCKLYGCCIEARRDDQGCRFRISAPVGRGSYGRPQPGPENSKSIREMYWNCIIEQGVPLWDFSSRRPGLVWGTTARPRKLKIHKRNVLALYNRTGGAHTADMLSVPRYQCDTSAIPVRNAVRNSSVKLALQGGCV